MKTLTYHIEDLLILNNSLATLHQQLEESIYSINDCRSEIKSLVNSKNTSDLEFLINLSMRDTTVNIKPNISKDQNVSETDKSSAEEQLLEG